MLVAQAACSLGPALDHTTSHPLPTYSAQASSGRRFKPPRLPPNPLAAHPTVRDEPVWSPRKACPELVEGPVLSQSEGMCQTSPLSTQPAQADRPPPSRRLQPGPSAPINPSHQGHSDLPDIPSPPSLRFTTHQPLAMCSRILYTN